MSFSFQVNGHAGNGMDNTDEDEGAAVKALQEQLLAAAKAANLNVSLSQLSMPESWRAEHSSTFDLPS